jgi:hypothetical protein
MFTATPNQLSRQAEFSRARRCSNVAAWRDAAAMRVVVMPVAADTTFTGIKHHRRRPPEEPM